MAIEIVDRREQLLNLTDSLDEAAFDKYAYTRDIFMKVRNKQLGIATPDDDIDIDDLVGSDDEITDESQAVEAAPDSINLNDEIDSEPESDSENNTSSTIWHVAPEQP